MKAFSSNSWLHFFLLLVWSAIGTGLRFTNLISKSPWNDEFATLVFSLGNSFRTIPLDQAIALDTLLQPLQPNSEAGINTVINHLMTESTHPPVYFVLTHLWLQLFSTTDELASFWAVRSLSAIFGVISIPAVFGLGWLAFRSRLVGQLAAAIMAVSPYGIYQAQEARHYTLAILLIIASLCCLVIATRTIHHRIPLPIWLGLVWVGINSLGIAVHYFFTFTLCAEALVLMRFWIIDFRFWINRKFKLKQSFHPPTFLSKYWWRIYAVAAGTLIGGLVWIPALQSVPDNRVTQWIYNSDFLSNWLEVIARILAWIITMVSLLPIENTSLPVIIASSTVLLLFIFWALPIFISGIRIQLRILLTKRETQVLSGYILAAITLLFCISFSLGADLTIAARYHFFYFPAVIVLLAATLAICWDAANLAVKKELGWTNQQQSLLYFLQSRGKTAVAIIWLMSFVGGLTVVSNLGYQKPDRADLLVPIIQHTSQVPVLIATAHKTHEQTGEMMGLGIQFKHLYRYLESATNSETNTLKFLLAHQEPDSSDSAITLQKTLTLLPRPLDLWLVNFPRGSSSVATQNCVADLQHKSKVNGYKYQLYHCQ